MSVYKIFISSPGDVGRERHLAEQAIHRVAAEFQERVEVQPYFWEYEPMESTRDYQENIPLTSNFDLVICIVWKRLGSPLSVKHERPDGGRWRSGTEFELMTALESRKREAYLIFSSLRTTRKRPLKPTTRPMEQKPSSTWHNGRRLKHLSRNGARGCRTASAFLPQL